LRIFAAPLCGEFRARSEVMKKLLVAIALMAGAALAGEAVAQSSSTSSDPSSPSGGVLVDASSIIGATVRSQGKDVGKVDRLMVDPKDGRVKTVVIQMGGTLGVGGKSVSMPWESMKVGQDNGKIVVTAEQQVLDQAPSASPRTDSKSDSSKSDSKK
jgi:sporulation protein YlmC with PRC-barrel domain